MNVPVLNPEEFRDVVRACERVLINAYTPAQELRDFLVARFRNDGFPESAARFAQLDDDQVRDLREQILVALQANEESALWR